MTSSWLCPFGERRIEAWTHHQNMCSLMQLTSSRPIVKKLTFQEKFQDMIWRERFDGTVWKIDGLSIDGMLDFIFRPSTIPQMIKKRKVHKELIAKRSKS